MYKWNLLENVELNKTNKKRALVIFLTALIIVVILMLLLLKRDCKCSHQQQSESKIVASLASIIDKTDVHRLNYWPINNDLKDYAGSSDLIPHDLNKVVFAQDRFNISNSALYLSNLQFYTVKPGVYFYGAFTITVWVKVVEHLAFSRVLDFGNGRSSDNIAFALSYNDGGKPVLFVFSGNTHQEATSDVSLSLNKWTHVAAVYDLEYISIYIDGKRTVNGKMPTQWPVRNVTRNECYIGNSPWPTVGDTDRPNAYFDEIGIYNVALNLTEISYLASI